VKGILTYHSIDDSGSVVSTSTSQLGRQIEALKSRGVRIVPLTTLHMIPRDVHAVALTFDDGFANFASAAAPVLLAHAAPATVFVIPSCVGGSNDWEDRDSRVAVPQLDLMGWAEIAQVRLQGFHIGGHSNTHRSLRGLDPAALESEVSLAAASIKEHVGADPVAFAFPYGDYEDEAIKAVARVYSFACTTEFGLLSESDSPHLLPRLDAYYFRGGQMLARWGTAEFWTYITGRRLARSFANVVRNAARGFKA